MTLTSKEKIIKAAIKVFAEKGYDGASMDKIAQAASLDLCALTLPAILMFHFSQRKVIQQLSKTADAKISTTEAIHSHIMSLFAAQSEGSGERSQQ